jgi:hypothetical protein
MAENPINKPRASSLIGQGKAQDEETLKLEKMVKVGRLGPLITTID